MLPVTGGAEVAGRPRRARRRRSAPGARRPNATQPRVLLLPVPVAHGSAPHRVEGFPPSIGAEGGDVRGAAGVSGGRSPPLTSRRSAVVRRIFTATFGRAVQQVVELGLVEGPHRHRRRWPRPSPCGGRGRAAPSRRRSRRGRTSRSPRRPGSARAVPSRTRNASLAGVALVGQLPAARRSRCPCPSEATASSSLRSRSAKSGTPASRSRYSSPCAIVPSEVPRAPAERSPSPGSGSPGRAWATLARIS